MTQISFSAVVRTETSPEATHVNLEDVGVAIAEVAEVPLLFENSCCTEGCFWVILVR